MRRYPESQASIVVSIQPRLGFKVAAIAGLRREEKSALVPEVVSIEHGQSGVAKEPRALYAYTRSPALTSIADLSEDE